jgi:hypothetical protein
MARFVVQHRYTSLRDGTRWGPWEAGQPIDLNDSDAAWVNTDSPGCLVLYVEPDPEPEPVVVDEEPVDESDREAKPARNRQYKGGRNRAAG